MFPQTDKSWRDTEIGLINQHWRAVQYGTIEG